MNLLLVLLLAAPAANASSRADLPSQVVALTVTYQTYDGDRPWSRERPRSREASAVVVAGNRLLTTAQVVADATMIRARKHGAATRVAARLLHVDEEIDLALVAVDEDGFFDDLTAAAFLDAPLAGGTLLSSRWQGGQFEMANSRFGRVEVSSCATGNVAHAFLEVTTDLSGGGWSEPVFADGALAGLTVSQTEQRARVMPADVLRSYVAMVDDEEYAGFAALDVWVQNNHDRAVARFLGMEGAPRGVIIRRVSNGTTGCDVLRARDVLLELDGHALDTEGYYRHPVFGRTSMQHILVDGHRAGDVVPARVLRDGTEQEVAIRLRRYPESLMLIPSSRSDHAPPYLVAGGLVFRELDEQYLETWGQSWKTRGNSRLVAYWELERASQRPDRRRIILLVNVLPDPYNIGYHDLRDLPVTEVNGRPIDTISDLHAALAQPVDGYHVVRFAPNLYRSEVVLDAATFEEATARVMANYSVPEAFRAEPVPIPPLDGG